MNAVEKGYNELTCSKEPWVNMTIYFYIVLTQKFVGIESRIRHFDL